MFCSPQPVHFAGIGGIGMSGLAEILFRMGWPVSGSDARESASTRRLRAIGIDVSIGHCAENLPADAAALVITSAVKDGNPELEEARRRRLPVVRRGELLAELMRTKRGAVVAGSHGKTTTSSMLAAIAIAAGLDPSAAIGSTVPALGGSNARLGGGDWFVAESDESDGSFLELTPEVAVITNIDREHLDHYGSFENVRASFVRFADRTCFAGSVVACADDAQTVSALSGARRRTEWYGRSAEAGVRIESERSTAEGSTFVLSKSGRSLGVFELQVLGRHNVLNACGAVAAAMEMGVDAQMAASALRAFEGAGRRMEKKGSAAGITVVDDYAHHPTEVRTTLEALKLLNPGRLVVLFQPHRYTRTAALLDEFAASFQRADLVFVTEIYAASEPPIEGVSGLELVRRIRRSGHEGVEFKGGVADAVSAILSSAEKGDLIVTMGAGNVTEAGPMIVAGLSAGLEASRGKA